MLKFTTILVAGLLLAGCATDPVSTTMLGLRLVGGVAGAIEASSPPEERVRRRLPEHCAAYKHTVHGPQCVQMRARAPDMLAIKGKNTSAGPGSTLSQQPARSEGGASFSNSNYANCMYAATVERKGVSEAC